MAFAHHAGAATAADELHGGATRGRCIYCDQRCDASAIYHEYCREAHEQEQKDSSPPTGVSRPPLSGS